MHPWFNISQTDKYNSSCPLVSDPNQMFAGDNVFFLFAVLPPEREMNYLAGEMILGESGALACVACNEIPMVLHINQPHGLEERKLDAALSHTYWQTNIFTSVYAKPKMNKCVYIYMYKYTYTRHTETAQSSLENNQSDW